MIEDPFFQAYDREEITYGLEPSLEVAAFIAQIQLKGLAIDLGAGIGRNALALATAGLNVLAIDRSPRGLERLRELAEAAGLSARIQSQVADLRSIRLPERSACIVVATTILDHVAASDGVRLWHEIESAITDQGVIYAEVHTTEDPGSDEPPGCNNLFPVSETASSVKHYFQSGELLRLALTSGRLRVLRYEERQEWDYTHGDEHHHGKATILAVPKGHYPAWYGHPCAFPRRD